MLERSFRGLDLDYNKDGVAPIEQGLSGVARAYHSETHKDNNNNKDTDKDKHKDGEGTQ
jgi:hypothetical protein